MVRARVVAATIVLAAVARAAGPCEEERAATGLALANREGVLAVGAIDKGSVAERAGFQVDDLVVQVNATVPRACADYARVVRDARRDRVAILVLVRRGAAELPLVMGAATWASPAPEGGTVPPPAPPATSPSPTIVPPPPPPLPPEVPVSLDAVLRGIAGLAPAERPPAGFTDYSRQLERLHQQVETLAARGAAPPATLDGLRAVLRYFDAAGIAWGAMESERERSRLPRHVPVAEEATAPFFEDSPAAAVLEQFDFLRGTVAREPSAGRWVESSGLWRPAQARAILWAHGREALARLEGRLGVSGE